MKREEVACVLLLLTVITSAKQQLQYKKSKTFRAPLHIYRQYRKSHEAKVLQLITDH